MEQIGWAYIAGFFDGEGCLHAVGPSVGGKGRFRVTISQSLDVGRITLEEIASFLSEHGIRAYVLAHRHSKRLEKPHWRQVWNLWITEQQSIVWFIEG
ncbi:MAG TPA: LAGLIDADG family homing endonuclease, partial [Terriglobales bacterium]|nr:LAGLIDADG family homing endonuclease [Terriglobales bacterium]